MQMQRAFQTIRAKLPFMITCGSNYAQPTLGDEPVDEIRACLSEGMPVAVAAHLSVRAVDKSGYLKTKIMLIYR
jgi:hypothetical protein